MQLRGNCRWPLRIAIFLFASELLSSATPAPGPLRVFPENPRYFSDGKNAVYLAGFQYWDVFDAKGNPSPDGMTYEEFLKISEKYGVNFIRLWRWNELTVFKYSQEEAVNHHLHPWQRTGPGNAFDGKPKFDLTKFEQPYFDKLRSRIKEAGKRGMYVAVMLFEGWSLRNGGMGESHPYHKNNNINGINGDPNNDGRVMETHTLKIPAITALQEAYVRKVIDTINDLDNVLYEIANEDGDYSVEWQYHMIHFIRKYEATKPKLHLVGMTCLGVDDLSPSAPIVQKVLRESPADWISPYTKATAPYNYLDNPPPSDGKKVIISDTDHLLGNAGDRSWVWKSFTRGLNINNYMELRDLRSNESKFEKAKRATGNTVRFAKRMNLAAAKPDPSLSSTTYCLAVPGFEYLIYQPKAGLQFTVDLKAGTYKPEWFNLDDSKTAEQEAVKTEGGKQQFKAPFQSEAVLYLKRI